MTLTTFESGKATAVRNVALVRRFVATGDPRCPLAAVWTAQTVHTDAVPEEPSLFRPVMERLRRWWRAIFRGYSDQVGQAYLSGSSRIHSAFLSARLKPCP